MKNKYTAMVVGILGTFLPLGLGRDTEKDSLEAVGEKYADTNIIHINGHAYRIVRNPDGSKTLTSAEPGKLERELEGK